jgi:anti-anti-sigma regulatory factor
MGADSPALRVGYLNDGLYVHVNGRATQRLCPTLERLVQTFIEARPQRPIVTLDLDGCVWADSTFAGWLLGLRRQLQPCGGQLRLSGVSERCRASLARMQLVKLFEFCEVAPPAETSVVSCTTGDRPDRETLEIMLRAHESLAAVGGDNARVFEPVIAVLRRQLGQSQG